MFSDTFPNIKQRFRFKSLHVFLAENFHLNFKYLARPTKIRHHFVVPMHVLVVAHCRANAVAVKVAAAVDGLVWIGVLGVDAAIRLDVAEGAIGQAALAAVIAVRARAVDEVRFGERDERRVGDERVRRFERTCCWSQFHKQNI